MSARFFKKAVWVPGWHELDQSLVVGQRKRFWFLNGDSTAAGAGLVFSNKLNSRQNSQERFASVSSLNHAQLGPLRRIDTDGLDYIFETVEGREFVVNAEEEPGVVYDSETQFSDWSVVVTLMDVSEPMGG